MLLNFRCLFNYVKHSNGHAVRMATQACMYDDKQRQTAIPLKVVAADTRENLHY